MTKTCHPQKTSPTGLAIKSIFTSENSAQFSYASSKSSAFDLTAKGILPVTTKLSLYGKLGIAYLRPNSQGSLIIINPPYNGTTNSYSKTLEPTFGLGVSYALKPNVPVEFSWNRIQKIGGSNHAPSSDFYSLGVSYYFG